MAKFAKSRISVPDASSKEKVRAVSSVKSLISVLEANLSHAANTISGCHTQRGTDSSRSSVSLASASTTREQSLTDSNGCVKNIICTKPPMLPKTLKPKSLKTHETQNKFQRESSRPCVPVKKLPDVRVLRGPPPKPDRPPNVDIRRFRRSTKPLNDGPGMMMPRCVAPSLAPPPFNHIAVFRCTKLNTMSPPSHPNEEHPSNRTENKGPAHVIEKGKTPAGYKGGESAFSLNQGRIIQSTVAEDPIYDDVDNPETRGFLLPQPTTDGDDIYDDVDYQRALLPFDRPDIYDNMNEGYIYEIE
ncbi:FYN-binding protein 1-like [Toxotes jaculatrix]|uniref:FYN-binding protein 1-like n=1 Tax=Toxotes jaculatrix TaxID=941984 RepID=UPI001B3ADA79|nr:FYN-binding protein 1-like [Toxotes jaculatrix]